MIQLHCPIDNKRKTQWFTKQSSVATNRLKGFCTVKKTIIIEAIAGIVSSLCAVSCFADIKDGVAVTTLPAADETGAYVFGNADYTTSLFYDETLAAGLAYPAWDEIGVPSGATLKFVGGVALSSLPDGCTFDFSGCTHLLVTDNSVFGSGFTVPELTTLLYQKCNVSVYGSVASFLNPDGDVSIESPLVINGTNTVGKQRGNVIFNGAVTGADTGYMELNGFGRHVTFKGALNFGGTIRLRNSQRNQRIIVNSAGAESSIGTLEGNDWGNDRTSETRGAPQQLIYLPASQTPCTMIVGRFNQNETGGLLEPDEAGNFRYRRWGVLLATCSNNTVCVSNIVRHGAYHLMACSDGAYTFGNEPAFDQGFGNFEIVHLGKNAQGHADRSPKFYPSPNVNLKFTGRFTGNYRSAAPSFDYTGESNTVNRGTLDMSGAESYEYEHQPILITGYSPWNLPRSIKVHPNLAATTTNIVTDTRWVMPLDFGAAPDEIDVARCETDAILSVPESCMIVVSNATTAAGAAVIPGRYPVITGSAVVNAAGATGSAAFADWTVELAGRWGGCDVLLEMSDTGLYIVVKQSGLSVFLR